MSAPFWTASEILGALIVLMAAVYIYYKYYIFDFWRKLGMFYVEPVVPFGNAIPIIMARISIAEFFKDLYDEYKHHRLFGTYIFFKPNLVVADPDLIRDILAKEFSSFHDRGVYCNEKIDPLTGHLFSLSGKKWRNLRVKLTPTFTSGKIKQMFQTLKETSDALAKFLEGKAEVKATIEIKDIFARYSTDIIMSTAFGINSNSLDNPKNEFRYWGKRIFNAKPLWNTIFIFAPQIFDFFSIPYTEKGVTKFFMKIFENTVDYRQTENVTRRDFMNLLIQLMKHGYVEADEDETLADVPAEHKKLTMNEAAAQAFVFFLAGFETSSTTATFCLYELAQNQDIQDKLREEIRTVLQKHGGLTYDAVMEMTYLHKVLSETMRKYPAVNVLNRICTKEIQLTATDTPIPEGTLVSIPVYGIHRDPTIYPDPEKFDPERFSEANIAARHPYVYLPFGEGPRICIGLRFGLIQTKVGLISILSRYKFKLAPGVPVPPVLEKGLLITTPKGGVNLIIEPAP